jgi:hypothetical protein
MTEQEKRALWAERVAAWQASGESMRTFAQRHDWKPRQLVWWRKRLSQSTTSPAPAPAMIPVSVKMSAPLRLTGPSWSLDLPATTPASWLADLLRAL